MGFFNRTPKGYGTNNTSNSLEDKPYHWFQSEIGIQTYNEYMVAANFYADEKYRKEFEEGDHDGISYAIFVSIWHKEHKSPFVYLRSLIIAAKKTPNYKNDALAYIGPVDLLTNCLVNLAEPYFFDDNGDPVSKETLPSPEKLMSVDDNPLLKFALTFEAFSFESAADWSLAYSLWSAALLFINHEVYVKNDWQVLEKNPWLFEKETYVNALGIMRTEKGFLTTGADKSNDKEYFEGQLSRLAK